MYVTAISESTNQKEKTRDTTNTRENRTHIVPPNSLHGFL